MVAVGPKLLESILVEEHRRQIRLRVQVRGDDGNPDLGIHPGKVIHQCGRADASLVVEERDRRHRAGLTVTSTRSWSTLNSGVGLPFSVRVRNASGIP